MDIDISERKKTEEVLQKSEQRLAAYADQMEQYSLSVASMISIKDEKIIFAKLFFAVAPFLNNSMLLADPDPVGNKVNEPCRALGLHCQCESMRKTVGGFGRRLGWWREILLNRGGIVTVHDEIGAVAAMKKLLNFYN